MERVPLFRETINASPDGFQGWIQGMARIIVAHYYPHDTWTYGYREFIGDRLVPADYDYPFPFFEVLVRDLYEYEADEDKEKRRVAIWIEMRAPGNGKIRVSGGGAFEIDGVAEMLVALYEALLHEYLPERHKQYIRYQQEKPAPRLLDCIEHRFTEWQWFDAMRNWIAGIPAQSSATEPPISANIVNNYGIMLHAEGDITVDGNVAGRDIVTNNTEVKEYNDLRVHNLSDPAEKGI